MLAFLTTPYASKERLGLDRSKPFQKLEEEIQILWNVIKEINKTKGNALNIGQLQKLRVLDLAENRIDNIPNEIGRLRVLQKLILQTNNLSQLPRAIGYVIRF